MLTHLIKSINWIDVALIFLFIRIVFVGVKNGFIAEFFKFLGVVAAVFVSLHYYSFLAAQAAAKTNISWDYWNFTVFAGLWFAVAFFFKFFRDGALLLFKVETTHEGFDKYAAGILAVARGLLVCSMAIFLVLLSHNAPLGRMSLRSCSYKVAGRAAVMTYTLLYRDLFEKFYPGSHYNEEAPRVLHPGENWPPLKH